MEGQKQAERREKEQERRMIREGEMANTERRREIANREHPPGQLGGLGLHEELHPE